MLKGAWCMHTRRHSPIGTQWGQMDGKDLLRN